MEWLKTHRNDVILVAVLLALGGALALGLTRQDGGIVRVQSDGEVLMELPLSEDTQVVLGQDGQTNTLVIENGGAQMAAADCPDQICVNHGTIRYAGESIVCLPHKLVVSIEGGKESPVDGTAG